jgi:hypothetical protein
MACQRVRVLVLAALFRDGLAPSTVLLWPMNLINLFNNYFMLLWLPAILHGTGVTPPWAIFGARCTRWASSSVPCSQRP